MRDAFGRVQTALVLGGGSEIAHATLAELLRDGPLTAILAARDPDALETAPLEQAGATVLRTRFDAAALDEHGAALAAAFAAAPGDVDLVLLAFGVLPEQAAAERDARLAADVATTNFVGAVSALTIVLDRLREQGHGTIVVLSSAAAQRARRSNYVYGASKAGLDAFAQGLRLAAAGTGVRVLVVRPGFVRTKMTRDLRPAPLSVVPDAVARAVATAVARGDEGVIWVPRALRYAMWIVQLLPPRLLQLL